MPVSDELEGNDAYRRSVVRRPLLNPIYLLVLPIVLLRLADRSLLVTTVSVWPAVAKKPRRLDLPLCQQRQFQLGRPGTGPVGVVLLVVSVCLLPVLLVAPATVLPGVHESVWETFTAYLLLLLARDRLYKLTKRYKSLL